MDLYKKNMEVLEQYHNSLYEALKEKEKEIFEKTLKIVEKKAINGELILEIEKNNQVYRLNSMYDPSHEADVWSKQYKGKDLENVFVIFGFGNGYFIKALKEHIKDRRVIIIYEPSYEVFRYSLERYDFTDIFKDSGIGLVVRNINEASFMNLLSYVVKWNNINAQVNTAINQYCKIFKMEFMVFINRIIENNTNVCSNQNTVIRFGKTDTYNSIENARFLYQSNNISEFVGKIPEHIPVIVVAAGPSLEKNVDQIKKAKGKAIIISVDRALDILIKHDIMPDFSITIDAEKPPRFYDNPITWEIPIFYPLSANRKIIGRHTGRKILLNTNPISNEYFRRLKEKVIAPNCGGSVATAAVAVAITLNIRNIILVGQDLAYENGITHAGGVKLGEEVNEKQLVKVKGIHGEELYTGWDMYSYILWYQQSIENFKDDVQIVDATEGGALIRGTKIMTLEEAINTYCTDTFDVQAMLNSVEISDIDKRYQMEIGLLEDTIEQLKEFKKLSDKAGKLCADLLTNIITYQGMNNKGIKMSKQLSELNKKMNVTFVSILVEEYVADSSSSALENIYTLEEDEIANQRKTFESSRDLYAINKTACDEIIAYIEPMLEEIRKN